MNKALNDLLSLFKDAVVTGDRQFLSEIEQGGKISPQQRVHVYAHAYRARLSESLLEDYPILHEMLGDESFDFLCNEYIDAQPSDHASLRFFGGHLEAFLFQNTPFSNEPALGEMARFEWALRDVFDGKDESAVSLEELGSIPPESWTILRFKLHPTYKIINFKWNILNIWQSVKEQEMAEQESDEFISHKLLPSEISVLLWRDGLISRFRSLEKDELEALRLVEDFKAFPDICEELALYHAEEAPQKAVEFLQEWMQSGMITKLDYARL